jgi:hypothetical protein
MNTCTAHPSVHYLHGTGPRGCSSRIIKLITSIHPASQPSSFQRPKRKHLSQQFFYGCLRIRCSGNSFTEPLPSNGRLLWLHYSGLQASCHNNILPLISKSFQMVSSFQVTRLNFRMYFSYNTSSYDQIQLSE